jgi:hypothetical protein
MIAARFFGLAVLLACLSFSAHADDAVPPPEPNAKQSSRDFQWQIVEFFNSERCDLVRDAAKPSSYSLLRPNILAIVAFCEPRGQDHEKLFREAEKRDPTGDLIMVLHAKYVWKRSKEKARPLWENVLKHARNTYLKSMAKRYLEGEVEKDEILHLSPWSYQGKFRLGGGYESNPVFPYAGNPGGGKRPQSYGTFKANGGVQRWVSFGSYAANYEGSYVRYSKSPELSMFGNQLEVPITFRLGAYEDIVFRPFAGLSYAGSRSFEQKMGFGILGVAYRPEYKQSVQGSIFTNNLFFPEFNAEEGTHLRFDYNWEFFPSRWTYRFQAFMEHLRAVNDFDNGTDIKHSHTDLGGLFGLQLMGQGITYEFDFSASFRLDSLPSEYTGRQSGVRLRKRRNDVTIDAKPGVTIPLWRDFDLNAFYEYTRTFSPLRQDDYTDYNMEDHAIELVLLTEFSNY